MQPLAVDLVLLRATAPDLPLVVGRILAARVVERQGERRGILNLAGAYVTAELPEDVEVGARLRLMVREVTSERVVLQLAEPPPTLVPAGAAEARAPFEAPVVRVEHREETDPSREHPAHVVAVYVEDPRLGRVEVQITLDEQLVHARAALPDGPPLKAARRRAGELRAALATAARRPAEVDVVAGQGPLDVYG